MKTNLHCFHLASLAILALVVPVSAATVIFSDNFDGSAAAGLNGTTPDTTTAGANWVAMNNATNGRVFADGTIDVSGGTSANRGGSATLAFTPTVGLIYTLDLSALNLTSSASNTTANRFYFGFAKGQSAGNGTATQLTVGAATVQGQITQGFMTKVGYSTTTNPNSGLGGIENASFNDSTSTNEWTALATAFGGSIDLRIVLDTTGANWTATWYAKRPTTETYSLTRATEEVNTTDINSVGFGLSTFAAGRISSFTLTAVPEPNAASSVVSVCSPCSAAAGDGPVFQCFSSSERISDSAPQSTEKPKNRAADNRNSG